MKTTFDGIMGFAGKTFRVLFNSSIIVFGLLLIGGSSKEIKDVFTKPKSK